MKKLSGVLAFIICLPLICTMFIKPDKENWKKVEEEDSVIDQYFEVIVEESGGSFSHKPEELTVLFLYRIIPETIEFTCSEDYISDEDTAHDPDQEYLKALSIVCRTNIVAAWEREEYPKQLDFEKIGIDLPNLARIPVESTTDSTNKNKMEEIKRAANITLGAVITKDNHVMAAPFFTTSDADMLVGEAGEGIGFSLNYAYELAEQGMDFYEILKYFFEDIKITIYE